MGIEGVKLLKDISIGHCDPDKEQLSDWLICIEANKKPVLCEMSAFSYHKGVLPLNINKDLVEDFLKELREEEAELKELAKKDKTLKLPQGIYSGSKDYTTILNDFPDTYGIGQEGLSARATTQRKSQAKQLKSYLIFFDKILASYFQHLYKVKDLLSITGEETETYFSQALTGIKDFDELMKGYPSSDEDVTQLVFQKFDNDVDRRNQIIDHLLSRFAESFGDYAFLMNMLYGSAAEEVTLINKRAFLKDYIAISSERGCGFNYYKQPHKNLWNTENISGFQKRVSRLVGVKDYSRRHLTASFVKINEHINGDKVTYSWHIQDNDGIEVLSSFKKFRSISRASASLYDVVLLITQTTEEKINELFKAASGEKVLVNFKLTEPSAGNYSWNIIDFKVAADNSNYVLAQHNNKYGNLTLLKKKILELIKFIKYDFTEEGMFLVEHMLLRPDITDDSVSSNQFMPICADDCEEGCGLDPYSFKVSIVLPGFTYRFSNPDFRNYMENIIREELPAHVVPRICWVGSRREEEVDAENDLWRFENAYKEYLKAKNIVRSAATHKRR